jgi:hypothetical protein
LEIFATKKELRHKVTVPANVFKDKKKSRTNVCLKNENRLRSPPENGELQSSPLNAA